MVVTPCPLLLCHSWSFKMSEYGVTLKDLKQVVENYRQSPDVNFPNTMNEIGGSEGLMQKLKTTADGGIRVDSMESRQEAFGPNSMPVKPPPTYLELCWEALQDATLVMLIIAAVVSLVLGFAFEEDKSTAWCVPSARAVCHPVVSLCSHVRCVFPAAYTLLLLALYLRMQPTQGGGCGHFGRCCCRGERDRRQRLREGPAVRRAQAEAAGHH